MAAPSRGELPQHAMIAASFAENLARKYAEQLRPPHALFAAFVGLVSARDQAVAADCLTALDRYLSGDASAGNGEPSV